MLSWLSQIPFVCHKPLQIQRSSQEKTRYVAILCCFRFYSPLVTNEMVPLWVMWVGWFFVMSEMLDSGFS
jgi:hypothetical protein